MRANAADPACSCARLTANLTTPGQSYGGWESTGVEVRGQFIGHYLSATAFAWKHAGEGNLVRGGWCGSGVQGGAGGRRSSGDRATHAVPRCLPTAMRRAEEAPAPLSARGAGAEGGAGRVGHGLPVRVSAVAHRSGGGSGGGVGAILRGECAGAGERDPCRRACMGVCAGA